MLEEEPEEAEDRERERSLADIMAKVESSRWDDDDDEEREAVMVVEEEEMARGRARRRRDMTLIMSNSSRSYSDRLGRKGARWPRRRGWAQGQRQMRGWGHRARATRRRVVTLTWGKRERERKSQRAESEKRGPRFRAEPVTKGERVEE